MVSQRDEASQAHLRVLSAAGAACRTQMVVTMLSCLAIWALDCRGEFWAWVVLAQVLLLALVQVVCAAVASRRWRIVMSMRGEP